MTLAQTERTALIEAVRRAARDHILPTFRALAPSEIRHKSGLDDLVTSADLAAEAAIGQAARTILPDALIVGEEAAAADPSLVGRIAGAGLAVIIDPIDGTWNYAHGVSSFGVILAVTRNGETVFGLLYDPLNDDWIEAASGEGAWYRRHDVRHRLRQPALLDARASDLAGIAPIWLFEGARKQAMLDALTRFRRIDALRCSCHEYRIFAQGSVDFMLSATAKPWDHAAGVLIARETGAVARMLDGSEYCPGTSDEPILVARTEAMAALVADTLRLPAAG